MRTVLGVSNISFGLPCRTYLNTITLLTMAMYAGWTQAYHEPSSSEGDDGGGVRSQRAASHPGQAELAGGKYIERFVADRVSNT